MAIDFFSPKIKANHLDQTQNLAPLRKQKLSEKLANLRKRMTKSEELVNQIKGDQQEMRRSVEMIQHDQETVAKKQEQLKETKLILASKTAHIQHNYLTIQHLETHLTFTLKCLVYCILDIYGNQSKAKSHLGIVEKHKGHIHHKLSLIHHDKSIIKARIQDIEGVAKTVEEKRAHIHISQKEMKNSLADIEAKSHKLLDSMPTLLPTLFSHIENKKNHVFSKDKKSMQPIKNDWFHAIQELCLQIIEFLGAKVTQAYHYFVR